MDGFVIRGASSELAGWNFLQPPAGGGQDIDPAMPGGSLYPYSTTPPTDQSFQRPSILGDTPEDRTNDAYHPVAPLYDPSYDPFPLSGQALDGYQGTGEGETGEPVFGDTAGFLPPSQGSPPDAFGVSVVPHGGLQDGNASYGYDWAGVSYADRQHTTQFSPTPHADAVFIPLAQGSIIAGGFHREGQSSSAELNYDQHPHDGGRPGFLDFEGTYPPHPTVTGYRPQPDRAQATGVVSRGPDVQGHADLPLPHTAGVARNEEAMRVPVAPPPMGIRGAKVQRPRKRKRSPTPDEGRKRKRARRKKPQDPDAEAQAQVVPVNPLSTRPDLRLVEQNPYKCGNEQRDWESLASIDFRVLGVEGIRLTDAMNLRFSDLDGRDDPMFEDETIGNSVSCRIGFVRHRTRSGTKSRQIVTKNHRKEHGPTTRQKLARDVAKCIKSYLEKGEATFQIPFEDMFLVRLHNVSRASWQPEVWCQGPPSTGS